MADIPRTGVAQADAAADRAVTVHVVLPVHNRKDITLGFVRCLLQQTYARHKLLLIDDGSTDGTAEAVRALMPDCTVLRGAGDWWWAGALHQGYEHIAAADLPADDLVLICNDDTTFEPDFLHNAVRAMHGKRNCMMLAQLYDDKHAGFVEAGVHVDWRTLTFVGVVEPERINCFATRGLFQRVDDFISLGGFYPRLLPHYASDYEYTIRAHQRGRALLSDATVRLSYNETTTGNRALSATTLRAHLREVFSTRYVGNPVYRSTFILLACPARWQPVNLYRVWRSFVTDMVNMTMNGPKLRVVRRIISFPFRAARHVRNEYREACRGTNPFRGIPRYIGYRLKQALKGRHDVRPK